MAGKIEKGKINSLDQDKHLAKVLTESGLITYDLVIPFYLRKESGDLKKEDEVIFVVFDDNTGMILHRMDGDWEYKTIKSLEVHGDFKVKKNENEEDPEKTGLIIADDHVCTLQSVKAGGDMIAAGDVKASDAPFDAEMPEQYEFTPGVTLRSHVHSYTTPVHSAGMGDTTPGK